MKRKDEIFRSFLSHGLLTTKYKLSAKDIPSTVRDGLVSNIPIVKAIALIVENLEQSTPITDSALRNLVTQYLSEAAI